MSRSRYQTLRLAIAATSVAIALILVLAPTFVRPVDRATGVAYSDLPAEHPQHVAARAPQKAVAVFVLCLGLWVTNIIPLPTTSLLAIALLPLLDILPQAKAFAYFGNSAVFFLLGVFILAAAMIDTGLSKRLTLLFLHRFDRSPRRLVIGVLVCASFFSLWMPEHAVAAMMYPIILEIAESLGLRRPGSTYARSLFLSLSWGAMTGGVGTYLGGARAVLAAELFQNFTEKHYPGQVAPSFVEFAIVAAPIAILLTVVAYFVITWGARAEINSISQATRMLTDRVATLGPLSGRERRLAILAAATIVAWIVLPAMSQRLLGYKIDLGVIAIVSAVLVFVLRIVQWNRIQDYVNWGVLVMYGGAVALGAAVADTRAMQWLAASVVPHLAENKWLMLVCVATISILLTEGMSNAAVVSLLLPLGFAFCEPMGISPLAMLYIVTIPAGLGYCLPMSSPPNAIAFSSGYYGIGGVVRRGMVMNLISLVAFVATALLYWPLIGLR